MIFCIANFMIEISFSTFTFFGTLSTGGSWVLERNVLFKHDANEKNCVLQCLLRDECEHTTNINIW